MATKRRIMFYQNKKQGTREIATLYSNKVKDDTVHVPVSVISCLLFFPNMFRRLGATISGERFQLLPLVRLQCDDGVRQMTERASGASRGGWGGQEKDVPRRALQSIGRTVRSCAKQPAPDTSLGGTPPPATATPPRMDIEKLIAEVQKRPLLYDPRLGGNSWRELKPRLWVEVCKALTPDWQLLSAFEQEKRGVIPLKNSAMPGDIDLRGATDWAGGRSAFRLLFSINYLHLASVDALPTRPQGP
ncbi:hypothetical protein AAG570_006915 [Ranatra chinensis]|uniref:MADF domain-containing protein n=1 Tax=Ranatra chinensis TaxID=642074 RepID=A0ABD0YVG1_9HEMI